MANYLSDFISQDGPYLHTKAYHFRQDVHTAISETSLSDNQVVDDIRTTVEQLTKMSRQLQSQANKFLIPWGGSYKKASQDLFGSKNGDKNSQYRKTLNTILNSYRFVEIVNRYAEIEIDEKQLQNVITEHGFKVTKKMIGSGIKTQRELEQFMDGLISQLVKKSKSSGSRIYVANINEVLQALLGEVNQEYFRDRNSLLKQLTTSVVKKSKKIDWNKIYMEVKNEFLSYFPGDNGALVYIDNIKNQFINQGKKLKSPDYANVAGFILENLMATTINNDNLEIMVYDLGESSEAEIVEFADDFAKAMNIKNKQITAMGNNTNSTVQSGSDWVLVNSNGVMVRAQAKNSVLLAEEFEKQGNVNRPQPLKVQGSIKYSTLKSNLINHSKGTGLSKEDWMFLDYLIANILWIRAGGGVNKDKSGSYSSGVSGIQELINRLITKEVTYFLGVTLDIDDQVEAINAVVGGSNIFFVIDGLVLYPTYKIIDNIILQLRAIEGSLSKLYFSLGQEFSKPTSIMAEKESVKLLNSDWKLGDPYGPEVLKKGREAGNLIVDTLKIKGVNLNVDINNILQTVYNTILE